MSVIILTLLSSLLTSLVNAASRNQTFSERYLAFTYNSHLVNWTDGNDTSGIPYL